MGIKMMDDAATEDQIEDSVTKSEICCIHDMVLHIRCLVGSIRSFDRHVGDVDSYDALCGAAQPLTETAEATPILKHVTVSREIRDDFLVLRGPALNRPVEFGL